MYIQLSEHFHSLRENTGRDMPSESELEKNGEALDQTLHFEKYPLGIELNNDILNSLSTTQIITTPSHNIGVTPEKSAIKEFTNKTSYTPNSFDQMLQQRPKRKYPCILSKPELIIRNSPKQQKLDNYCQSDSIMLFGVKIPKVKSPNPDS